MLNSIQTIMSQTTYNEEQATQKLAEFNGDYIAVIKDFMGIKPKKSAPIKSLNQEIYRQIRTKLDSSMREYREQNPVSMEQVIENLQLSEEMTSNKQK